MNTCLKPKRYPTLALAAAASLLTHTGLLAADQLLDPVYRVKAVEGKQRFVTRHEFGFANLQSQLEGVAFLAVCTNEWPAGLVPVFAVEKTNRVELRRRPARGQENSSEPLFFALPPEDEPDASKLAGHWESQAVRSNGSLEYPAWELAIEADQVSGRFDQNTQYRFAYLTGGTFRSNRIELRAEYFDAVYLLTGDWHDGKLQGQWRRTDDSERGTWEASRGKVQPPASKAIVPLYEWRRVADGARRYALEGAALESGWERAPRPLCRVWRKPGGK